MLREALTIVQLRQPRCGLRYGIGACTATGTPKCYQTWSTCRKRTAYDPTGSIRWRFVEDRPGIYPVGDFADPDNAASHAIPVPSLSVTSARGELNPGGVLDGKSPFSVRSTVTVRMPDFAWDDRFGDFYLGDRGALPDRLFWACWTARNMFWGGCYLDIYEGYVGDALGAMSVRTYVLDNVEGPGSDGVVSLTGYDPLGLVIDGKPKFPEEMDVSLATAITAVATTIRVETAEPEKLTKIYGNATPYYMRIGNEALTYTGVTTIEPGVYDLTGCVRGVLGTAAASATADTACQRGGGWIDTPTYLIGHDLMTNHTPLPASFIDLVDWNDEGDTYLPTLRSTTFIFEPTLVVDLMGEVCQQGMFYLWWDETGQTIRMLAVRPPRGAVRVLNDVSHILGGSAELRRDPQSLVTRVFVYYDPRSPLKFSKTPADYRVVSGRVEADPEHPNAAGGPRPLSLFARFVNTEAHAVQIINRILNRYSSVPRFLTLRLDAKDRDVTVGTVCDVTTAELIDTEGRLNGGRWQVVAWEAIEPGEVYLIDLQTYDYIGLFAEWMADGSPDFDAATSEQRANGAWWADDDGRLPDGSPGYQWQ
jgi:hypothetical protein